VYIDKNGEQSVHSFNGGFRPLSIIGLPELLSDFSVNFPKKTFFALKGAENVVTDICWRRRLECWIRR